MEEGGGRGISGGGSIAYRVGRFLFSCFVDSCISLLTSTKYKLQKNPSHRLSTNPPWTSESSKLLPNESTASYPPPLSPPYPNPRVSAISLRIISTTAVETTLPDVKPGMRRGFFENKWCRVGRQALVTPMFVSSGVHMATLIWPPVGNDGCESVGSFHTVFFGVGVDCVQREIYSLGPTSGYFELFE